MSLNVPPFDPETMNAHELAAMAPQKPEHVPHPARPTAPPMGADPALHDEHARTTAMFDANPFGGNVVVKCLHHHPRWFPQYAHPENPNAPLILAHGGHWHMSVDEAIGTDMPSFGRAHPDHPGRDFEVVPDKRTLIKTQADLDRAIQNVREGKPALDGILKPQRESTPAAPTMEGVTE